MLRCFDRLDRLDRDRAANGVNPILRLSALSTMKADIGIEVVMRVTADIYKSFANAPPETQTPCQIPQKDTILAPMGLSPAAIVRQLGIDRATVRKYIACGMDPPNYGAQPRRPRRIDDFLPYPLERLAAYPGLSAVRLRRELRERGFGGGYTAVKRAVQEIRPERERRFEVRFETPPGEQAQVNFARFEVVFADEPGTKRIVWLLSTMLCAVLIWARFVVHQDLQSVLRYHAAAFAAIGGAPRGILYGRMKTAVIGEMPTLGRLQP